MPSLFNILIILHIAGGTIGLICGTTAVAVIKGKKAHLLNGKIYSISMISAAISALIISNLPGHKNIFLFAVGGFTFYMVTTGYRIVWLKRNAGKMEKPFAALDYGLSLFGLLFGMFLVYLSIKSIIGGEMFGIVPGVFGLVCINYARMDYHLFSGNKQVKNVWMLNHITRMMGALIASYTAFLVVNVQINMQWILWLLPAAIGSALISYFIKKFVPKRKL